MILNPTNGIINIFAIKLNPNPIATLVHDSTNEFSFDGFIRYKNMSLNRHSNKFYHADCS